MTIILSKPLRKPALKRRRALLRILRRAALLTGVAEAMGAADADVLQIVLVGAEEMAQLNQSFLGHQGATDVLAFNLLDGDPSPAEAGQPRMAAEIYVCPGVAEEARRRYGTGFGEECVLYAVHGMLHLTGMDDHAPAGRAAMRRAEARIMKELRAQDDLEAIFGY